jgi:uncharacterized iron-regulated membrane protein
MRKLLFSLHLYAALFTAVFALILGLTGSIMAFETEIDHLLHWKLSYVTPQTSVLSLAEIGTAVSKVFPGERIVGYGVSTSPDLSYQVGLERHWAYVNQYTGEVVGSGSGSDWVTVFLAKVHQFHLRLLITNRADPGKKIVSWSGVVILFLLLSGLYLWWPLKRVTIQWSGSSRRIWFDIHNVVGIFSLVFLLILSITGVMIGFERQTTPLLYRITGSKPARESEIQLSPPPGATPITPDRALEIARAALPGAAPFEINVPAPKEPYEIRLRFPEDRTPGGRSTVLIDPYTGKVLFSQGSRTAPAGARLVIANRAIHTGDIFGIPSKVLMSLASVMLVVQVVSGVLMWWKRKIRRPPSPAAENVG